MKNVIGPRIFLENTRCYSLKQITKTTLLPLKKSKLISIKIQSPWKRNNSKTHTTWPVLLQHQQQGMAEIQQREGMNAPADSSIKAHADSWWTPKVTTSIFYHGESYSDLVSSHITWITMVCGGYDDMIVVGCCLGLTLPYNEPVLIIIKSR